MKTPIFDFANSYSQKQPVRFHMPGHKGKKRLGFEDYDITEIPGADSLYEAAGIIAESQRNASLLFESEATFYSTEGSSQCIKAMLFLLLNDNKREVGKRPYIIATRNAHKAFFHGAALLDFEVVWWDCEERESLCSIKATPQELERLLARREDRPIGVYVTSPDYLGNLLPIKEIAEICHKYDISLAVDNAHGAYLHFLEEQRHPLDLGADICCDSAHKTLPVLTGGAYLHLGKRKGKDWKNRASQALAIFGSTSPSYLTLISLDCCNRYLKEDFRKELERCRKRILLLKEELASRGWQVMAGEPLKLTVFINESFQEKKRDGNWLSEKLAEHGIYVEYADPEFVVFMFTPSNSEEEILALEKALKELEIEKVHWRKEERERIWGSEKREQCVTIREAIFGESEMIPVELAVGRVCANPVISCPPAVAIVAAGERIRQEDLKIFQYYGIRTVSVLILNET